ncbi:5994_t:CDS:2, partial [Funneliformis geosporum]
MKVTFYGLRVSLENLKVRLREYNVIAGKQISMTSEAQHNECTTDINFAMPEDCVDKLNWSHERFNIAVFHKLKIKV